MHNYSPVLDRTIRSGPAFSQTGPNCSLRALDRTVQSFYPSPFSSGRKTGLNGPVQYFWDWTAVQKYWTVWSSLFKRSPKKSTVWTGPDHGQSSSFLRLLLCREIHRDSSGILCYGVGSGYSVCSRYSVYSGCGVYSECSICCWLGGCFLRFYNEFQDYSNFLIYNTMLCDHYAT